MNDNTVRFWHYYQLLDEKIYLDAKRTKIEVDFICNHIPASYGKLLDLQCGSGRISADLVNKGYDIIGVDSSAKMIDDFNKRADIKKENIHLIKDDMSSFTLASKAGSLIWIYAVIPADQELGQIIENIKNNMMPKSKYIFDFLPRDYVISESPYTSILTEKYPELLNYFQYIKRTRAYQPDTKTEKTTFEIIEINGDYLQLEYSHKVYDREEILYILKSNGLRIINTYGNFIKDEYVPKTSKRLIILAENA
jgi:SAM-dependent methyltransferase